MSGILFNDFGWALAIGFGAELFCWVAVIMHESALPISSKLVAKVLPQVISNETAKDYLSFNYAQKIK